MQSAARRSGRNRTDRKPPACRDEAVVARMVMTNASLGLLAGLALMSAFGIGASACRGPGGPARSGARQLVESGAKLVDVRTPEEFAAGHISGAVNIPLQDLDRRLDEVGAKDHPIVVYCRSGNRSGRAKQLLEAANFTAVHDLGPMSAW